MATLYFREFTEIKFLTKVVDGEIILTVLTLTGESYKENYDTSAAPDLPVEPRDVVQDNIAYVSGTTTTVKIRVEDDGANKMYVYSPSPWGRFPTTSVATRSEFDADIPLNDTDPVTIVPMFIEATSLNEEEEEEVVARRSQTVIIKHRQGA